MKTTSKIIVGLGLIIVVISLCLLACQKEITPGNQSSKKLMIYLTDHPCPYDSLFIDIRFVEVKIDTAEFDDDQQGNHDSDDDDDNTVHDQYGQWDTLNMSPGIYNIMNLRNGVDTLLASGNIPAGKVKKIRLTLGTNNSVVVAGISHPLNLYPGTNSYVYIKIEEEDLDDVGPGQLALWIDFDVCQSIQEHNGLYFLKPVIKAFAMENFGRIEGKVLPKEAHAFVTAFNASDTATAIPDEDDGDFKIRGLKAGIYSVWFKGSNGYRDTTITNVQVQRGRETEIPTITLRR